MEGFKHVRFGEFIDDKLTSETDSIIHQSVYNLQQRAEAAETFILPSSPHSSSSPFSSSPPSPFFPFLPPPPFSFPLSTTFPSSSTSSVYFLHRCFLILLLFLLFFLSS